MREELDDIICNVNSYEEFIQELLKRDYEVKEGKYLYIRPLHMNYKNFRKTASLGSKYTKGRIEERIQTETRRKK